MYGLFEYWKYTSFKSFYGWFIRLSLLNYAKYLRQLLFWIRRYVLPVILLTNTICQHAAQAKFLGFYVKGLVNPFLLNFCRWNLAK